MEVFVLVTFVMVVGKVRGGIDNLDEVCWCLFFFSPFFFQQKKVVAVLDDVIRDRERYFIHVDGALFAQILPFLSEDAKGKVPIHDFTRPISSLSVSGHKMMGCPMPSGVIVHRKQNIKVFFCCYFVFFVQFF
jgi:glutamate/tyrosine decarboxylase-like PLP-dependent enzyme